jgi:regulatory protein
MPRSILMSMQRAPRKLATESELYAAALSALARRAYSVHDMRVLLERKAADDSHVRLVLGRLKASSYIDDARYAREFAHQHAHGRRQGPHRITRELRRRGLPDRHIEAAIEFAFAEVGASILLRGRLGKLLARKKLPLDNRKLASIYRSLMMAGFDAEAIRRELRAASSSSGKSLENFEDSPEVDSEPSSM